MEEEEELGGKTGNNRKVEPFVFESPTNGQKRGRGWRKIYGEEVPLCLEQNDN